MGSVNVDLDEIFKRLEYLGYKQRTVYRLNLRKGCLMPRCFACFDRFSFTRMKGEENIRLYITNPDEKVIYGISFYILNEEYQLIFLKSLKNLLPEGRLWYLREPDFLPQIVTIDIPYREYINKMGELYDAGNLFNSEDEAKVASDKIRKILHDSMGAIRLK